ncbi:MAG: hypothetical protein ACRDJ4_03990, partial [Actinomycetota bacterium]
MRISPGAPKVEVSTTDRKITAHAGAVLLRETAEAIGLGPAMLTCTSRLAIVGCRRLRRSLAWPRPWRSEPNASTTWTSPGQT